jgi:hypothetical protein
LGTPRRLRSRAWPWAVAALIVAAACWTEPALDQVENSPGNLAMIVRAVEHRGPTLGATVGWNAVVRSVGVRPWWLYVPLSGWDRKVDVRQTPSGGETDSTPALLAALALVGAIGALRRHWDLAVAALIGVGLCAAIAVEAAFNPSTRVLAETLGYTMWWGSELGLWVWLILAWGLWLGLVELLWRPALRALRGRLGPSWERLLSRARLAAVALGSLMSLGLVIAVGGEVAATAWQDSHVYDYEPIRLLATGIEHLIPPRRTIGYRFGPLDLATQPIEPAIRFYLVRHGDRVLARGSTARLGPYYERYDRPVQWTVYLLDGTRPQRHMRLAARTYFTGPWGHEVVSAWVRKVSHGGP